MKSQSVSQLSEESGEAGERKKKEKTIDILNQASGDEVLGAPPLVCHRLGGTGISKGKNPCEVLMFDQHVFISRPKSEEANVKQ